MADDDVDDMDACKEKTFDIVLTVCLALCIFVVGLGLGAESTVSGFKESFRKPQAVICGLASQFFWMPFAAFLMTRAAGLKELTSIGVILVGSSPGGTTSNLFTFWARGNVPLSITMSFFSTLAAFFMLPLLILVYIKTFSNYNIEIPWFNIFASLLLIVIPTILGLCVRHHNVSKQLCGKYYWQILQILASIFGGVFVIAALIAFILRYAQELAQAPAALWILATIMEPLGCAFGFSAARFTGLSDRDQRTISLECGVQNFTFTMVMIKLTFEDCDDADDAILFCILYGIMYLVNSLWLIALFRYFSPPVDSRDLPSWWIGAEDVTARPGNWSLCGYEIKYRCASEDGRDGRCSDKIEDLAVSSRSMPVDEVTIELQLTQRNQVLPSPF